MEAPPKQSEAADASAPDTATTTTTARELAAPVIAEPAQDDDPATMLQAAFPALDKAIISEVLAAHGGNADAASMALLEMSDNTGTRNSSDHSVARNAQLVSDEAYARELMAQMEREHQEAYGRPLGTPPHDDRNAGQNVDNNNNNNEIDYSALNYVPRQRNSRPGQATGPTTTTHLPGYSGNSQDNRGQGRDELDQLAEQFNKFADTGKKTFTSLMSKAKDKYAQVQQQQQQQRGTSQGTSQGDARGLASGPITLGKFTLPSIPAPWQNNSNNSSNPPARPMSPRDAVRAESPGMRESAMVDYSRSPPPPLSSLRSNSDVNATPTQPIRMNNNSGASAGEGGFARSPSLGTGTATSATAAYSSSPSVLSKVGSNTIGSSPAKVQMLPRQTISLLDTPKDASSPTAIPGTAGGAAGQQSQPQISATSLQQQPQRTKTAQDSDDDSDVEYVRNPFNDDD